jgi:hypothetical protein
MKKRQTLSEARLRKIIYEELVRQYLIEEGLWDDVKSGVKKLSAYVSKQFSSVAASWAKLITDRVGKFNQIPDDAKKVMAALKEGMQATGETFQMDETLKAAKELGKIDALAIVQEDLEGPVKEKAQAAQVKGEGKYLSSIYVVLSEKKYVTGNAAPLNEDFGVTAAVGLGLAVMGGLPMLFKGLHKLADVLGAHKAAVLFEKAEKVTHHFEQKTIDFVMPDKLAHAVYMSLWKMGIKLTKGDEPLNEIEIKAEKEGIEALKKCKGLIYKCLLIYFAFNGIAGVLKAGASLLGFVEGTATTIKGVELAKGAVEVSKLVRAGTGGLAV